MSFFYPGGSGGNAAYNIEEYKEYIKIALEASPVHEVLVERPGLWMEGIRTRGNARPER